MLSPATSLCPFKWKLIQVSEGRERRKKKQGERGGWGGISGFRIFSCLITKDNGVRISYFIYYFMCTWFMCIVILCMSVYRVRAWSQT